MPDEPKPAPRPYDRLAEHLEKTMLDNLAHNAANPGALDAERFEKTKNTPAAAMQRQKSAPVIMSVDAHGHEHKGKGPGGQD
jgi:hypothetical protein